MYATFDTSSKLAETRELRTQQLEKTCAGARAFASNTKSIAPYAVVSIHTLITGSLADPFVTATRWN